MLSSQSGAALSGNRSTAGKSGTGLIGGGVRTGIVRSAPVGMLGGNGGRPGNASLSGPGQLMGAMGVGIPGRFEPDKEGLAHGSGGSDADSDSGDDDEPLGRGGGVKRERAEIEAAMAGQEARLTAGGFGAVPGGVAGAKPGKKTRGRVKIKMEFIDNKLRRYTTFSKRKTGIMKKVRTRERFIMIA